MFIREEEAALAYYFKQFTLYSHTEIDGYNLFVGVGDYLTLTGFKVLKIEGKPQLEIISHSKASLKIDLITNFFKYFDEKTGGLLKETRNKFPEDFRQLVKKMILGISGDRRCYLPLNNELLNFLICNEPSLVKRGLHIDSNDANTILFNFIEKIEKSIEKFRELIVTSAGKSFQEIILTTSYNFFKLENVNMVNNYVACFSLGGLECMKGLIIRNHTKQEGIELEINKLENIMLKIELLSILENDQELQNDVDICNYKISKLKSQPILKNQPEFKKVNVNTLLEKCQALLNLINQTCLECLMKSDIPENLDHFNSYFSHAIFENVCNLNTSTSSLNQKSWSTLLRISKSENVTEKHLKSIKPIFEKIVNLVIEPQKVVNSSSYLKFSWWKGTGELDSKQFKIIERVSLENKSETFQTQFIPVLPAIIEEGMNNPKIMGTVLEISYLN